jgi:penicillin-binding protein 1A
MRMLASENVHGGYTSRGMGGSPHFLRALACLAAVAAFSTSCSLLPDLEEEERRTKPLAQTSKIYDSRGRLITTLHAEEDRIVIPIERIPEPLQRAVVAVEDQRYWSHRGIDLRAVLRAAYVNASSGQVVEGGSTITQQYVRNAFTSVGTEQTIGRKLKEAALAWQLEKEYSKEEILGRYLNTVYFGQGAYGIQQGAKTYFSKPAWELTLAESALLAGLIAGPERYDPLDNPSSARLRRDEVLEKMLEQELISSDRYEQVVERPLGLEPAPDRVQYPAAYFVDYVKELILNSERFGETYTQRYNFLFEGGLRIYTTIDLDMQRYAEDAVEGILSERYDPHGALTAVDPRTGHIKAMVGGRNYFSKRSRFAKVNLATGGSTGRQAGSSFKPFALVAALENGILPSKTYNASPNLVLDEPPCGSPADPWNVENYEGASYGGSMSVEQGLINSVNVVYAQIIRDVGPEKVVEVAHRMGIRSQLRPYCSAVLGTNEVNTLEMASAFGTLANIGKRVRPIAIERIEDAEGRVIYDPKPVRHQVLRPDVAWTAVQIMRKVVLSGTGTAANLYPRQVAGKTGTAQMWRDAWFVGFTPQISAAVWVGHPQGQISMVGTRVGNVVGGSFPADIWRSFMTRWINEKHPPVLEFRQPQISYVSVPVDVTQGCRAVPGLTPAENVQYQQFFPGALPEPCTAAATTSVPSVVGMIAGTAYTHLTDAGFRVTQSIQQTDSYPAGTVLSQSPAGGTGAPPGSTVSLVVASG